MADVQVFHTVTGGAPIIAKAEKVNRCDFWTLEDPLYMLYYMDEDGIERVQVNNVTAFAKGNTINLSVNHILFQYEPSRQVLDHYNNTLLKQLTPETDDD
jgi:hypothetical protein